MKKAALLAAIAIMAGGGYYYFVRPNTSSPPTMDAAGETTDNGLVVSRKTIDYEAITKSALAEKASFLTATLKRNIVRVQHLEKSIRYTPFPSSRATVRVKYDVEYPIGYVLNPGLFAVSGGADGLIIELQKPQLVARPSVKLLSFEVLESGLLIDEKVALLELQQKILPQVESASRGVLNRPDVIPISERMFRGFLQQFLQQRADGERPPAITFRYR